MGRQHIQSGELRVIQKKTRRPMIIPIRPELQEILDATPVGHLTLLVTKSGKPYPANDFSEQFRVWCNAAGLPTACVVHGLRKAACRRMAEAGYSVSEIAAWSGHRTLSEIKRYTDGVDQARLARNALLREQNGTNTVKPKEILTVSRGYLALAAAEKI
jgi:integrase